jgi:hypothetical protein
LQQWLEKKTTSVDQQSMFEISVGCVTGERKRERKKKKAAHHIPGLEALTHMCQENAYDSVLLEM